MYTPRTLVEGPSIHPVMSSSEYLNRRYLREPTREDFTDTRLSAKLGSIALDRLVLLPPDISGIDIDTQSQDAAIHLTEIPQLRAGRENNRQQIHFGQLHISSDTYNPTAELVAAKYLHRTTVPRELNAALTVNKRFGADVAFAPVGFVRASSDKIGYLSKYEQSVTTIDNILWNETASQSQRESAIGLAGLWLASLHNHGIMHGDAQAKNIAADAANNLRYVDLEGAQKLSQDNDHAQTQRLLDISDLFNPTYMPPTSIDEDVLLIDSYLEHQDKKGAGTLDGADMIDTISSAKEQQ